MNTKDTQNPWQEKAYKKPFIKKIVDWDKGKGIINKTKTNGDRRIGFKIDTKKRSPQRLERDREKVYK